MTQQQVATNHAAVRTLAATMEQAAGHDIPDVLAIAGRAAAELIANGYRRVEPIPPRGNGGSDDARAEALAATRDAVAKAGGRQQSHPMASQRQLTKLAILLAEDGIQERPDRLAWCSAMVGRQLTSSSDLARDEAHHLIESLEAPPLPPEPERPYPAGETATYPVRSGDPLDDGVIDAVIHDADCPGGTCRCGAEPDTDPENAPPTEVDNPVDEPTEPDSWAVDDHLDWTPVYADEPIY